MLGYKALIWDPVSGYAVSPMGLSVWQGRFARAVCMADLHVPDGEVPKHEVPDESCTCGIYATGMVLWLLDYVSNAGLETYGGRCFSAVLRGSGKVVEHEMGWRAEAAEILVVGPTPTIAPAPRRFAEGAAEALGVPFEPSLRGLTWIAHELESTQDADTRENG